MLYIYNRFCLVSIEAHARNGRPPRIEGAQPPYLNMQAAIARYGVVTRGPVFEPGALFVLPVKILYHRGIGVPPAVPLTFSGNVSFSSTTKSEGMPPSFFEENMVE